MSTVTNSLNKVFFRQSATPEHTIASQEEGVVYYGTIVDGGLLIDDSGDGSLLPGPFATLVPYMDGNRVAFVLRSRRPLILSVEGGFGASDEYAGLASIGEQNAEGVSTVQQLADEAKARADAAHDAFDEFVPSVNGEITALQDRAEQVTQDMLVERDRVNAELGPVKGDLAVLKTTTIPALQTTLDAANAEVTTLQNTTIPDLQTALSNVEGAAQTADKRSTVSTAAPSVTTGFPQNAVWQRINTSGAVNGSWRLSGSSWVQMPLDPVVIPNLSAGIITSGVLNTARLNAQEIAAASGQFLSLSAGQITSGTINTNRLNAQEVAGAVGSFLSLNTGQITWDNAAGNNAFIGSLVGNSAFLERLYANQIVVAPTDFAPGPGGYESAYTLGSGGSFRSTSSDPTGKYIGISPAASPASERMAWGPLLPVRPGEKITFEAYATFGGTNPSTNWSTTMYWYGADGATAATGGERTYVTTEAASGGTTGWSRGVVTVPEGAAFARARFFSAGDATATGNRGFRNLNVKKQVGAILLEDGAVSADKLAATIALVTRLIAGPEDGFHVELDQTGVHFHSLVDGVTGPVEMLQINTPGTDGDAGNVFALRDPTDLGSLSMSINEAGQTSTSDLTVSNLTQLQDVAIRGRTFEDYLDTLPRGVVAWGEGRIAASRTIAASTVVTFGTLNFVAEPGRLYRVTATGPSVQASVASTVSVQLEINGDVGAQYGWLGAGWNKADMTRVYDASSLTVETQTTVAYLIGASVGGTGLTHGTYRNLTIIVEDVGPAITPEISLAVSQSGNAPVVPAKKQYTKTYAASWLRTYTANGSMSTYYNGKATQGNYGAGEMRGVIGFPNMLGDIGSADIVRVEAYVYMAHWWNNSGGTATIAMSTHASAPGTLSAGLSGGVATVKTAKPGGGWVTLPSSVWAGLKAGTWRGIGLIGTGQAGYGYATTAQLRVTYKK